MKQPLTEARCEFEAVNLIELQCLAAYHAQRRTRRTSSRGVTSRLRSATNQCPSSQRNDTRIKGAFSPGGMIRANCPIKIGTGPSAEPPPERVSQPAVLRQHSQKRRSQSTADPPALRTPSPPRGHKAGQIGRA